MTRMRIEQCKSDEPAKAGVSRRSLFAGAAAVSLAAVVPGLTARAASQAPEARLILLGTQGGPNFSLTRGETASALQVGERLYLVDCGYGALAGMKKAELDFQAVDAIFLTHLHDDHTSDLLPILTHMATQGRAREVVVYGPPGTDGLVEAISAAMTANATIRTADEKRPPGFLDFINAVEIWTDQPFMEDGTVTVSCARNTHFPADIEGLDEQRSFAYRFDWDRSIVFSGDTSFSEGLVALAKDTDVLVCEVLEPKAMRMAFDRMVAGGAFKGAEEGVWRHMLDTHATPEQVGRMAGLAGVKKLVLNHLAPGALLELPESAFKEGIEHNYHGPVIVGSDGMVVPL